jgi:hypothetical protein
MANRADRREPSLRTHRVPETVELMRGWRADLQEGQSDDSSPTAEYIGAVSTFWSGPTLIREAPGKSIDWALGSIAW